MRILALDLAATTGWATSDGEYGAMKFTWKKKPHGDRWIELAQFIDFLCITHKPAALVCEEGFRRGRWATKQLHSMITIAEMVAAERLMKFATVKETTLKKHAAGNGLAKKPQMLSAAKREGLAGNPTSDEVDALWLCHYAISENLFDQSGGIT